MNQHGEQEGMAYANPVRNDHGDAAREISEQAQDSMMQITTTPGMEITDEERAWAHELKECIEDDTTGRLRPLSDFEYVQHSTFCQGNLEQVLRQVEALQHFRDLYQPQDTVEQGISILEQYIQLQPAAIIHLDVCSTGEGVVAWNQGAVIPAKADSEENWRIHVMVYYYVYHSIQPTLHACREGAYYLIEGEGMGWNNFDMNFEQRLHNELWVHFPAKVKKIQVYNTNTMVTTAWSLLKSILPQDQRMVMELGCQIEVDSDPNNPKLALTDLYFQPSFPVAMKHLLQRVRCLLALRYHNYQHFKL